MNEAPQRIAIVLSGKKDAFDLVAVSELNFSAGRKRDQQRQNVASNMLVRFQQVYFVVPDVGELEAIRSDAGCVYRRSQVVVDVQGSQSSDAGGSFDAFAVAVASAIVADRVETLQCKSGGSIRR